MIDIAVKVHGSARAILKKEHERMRKAMSTAIKVEAFRLRKEASADLRKGQLQLKELAVLAKKYDKRTRKKKPKAPLKNFARGIVYKVDVTKMSAMVGFIGNKPGAQWQAKIVKRFQNESRIVYDAATVKRLHGWGIHIKPSTHSAVVPVRDVIGAMMVITAKESSENIRKNFFRKLRGERI